MRPGRVVEQTRGRVGFGFEPRRGGAGTLYIQLDKTNSPLFSNILKPPRRNEVLRGEGNETDVAVSTV